jgi:hypothetical protein
MMLQSIIKRPIGAEFQIIIEVKIENIKTPSLPFFNHCLSSYFYSRPKKNLRANTYVSY